MSARRLAYIVIAVVASAAIAGALWAAGDGRGGIDAGAFQGLYPAGGGGYDRRAPRGGGGFDVQVAGGGAGKTVAAPSPQQ